MAAASRATDLVAIAAFFSKKILQQDGALTV